MTTDQWCLCWSQRQNSLHVESLAEHLSANRRAWGDDAAGDYRVLHIGARAEVDAMAVNLRGTLASRDGCRERMAA